jgi:hypothetical protein
MTAHSSALDDGHVPHQPCIFSVLTASWIHALVHMGVFLMLDTSLALIATVVGCSRPGIMQCAYLDEDAIGSRTCLC